ncbi:uncharacterized protein AKAME5_002825500 [Lates japonicus]|uniref:Uncharacterized protein n=1 Tax=Lates japonicus TaxID=270547 RepID=A0AAD3R1K3_LATJO|nr:uncharacterized protein AKAME5_002825500 [Lates japonicus]
MKTEIIDDRKNPAWPGLLINNTQVKVVGSTKFLGSRHRYPKLDCKHWVHRRRLMLSQRDHTFPSHLITFTEALQRHAANCIYGCGLEVPTQRVVGTAERSGTSLPSIPEIGQKPCCLSRAIAHHRTAHPTIRLFSAQWPPGRRVSEPEKPEQPGSGSFIPQAMGLLKSLGSVTKTHLQHHFFHLF